MEEEAEGVERDYGASDSSPPRPAWSKPAVRNDEIGALARRLVGPFNGAPDFTAAPPLVEAVRERYGDAVADALANRILAIAIRVPAYLPGELDESPHRDWSGYVRELRNQVRQAVACYELDFASGCGVLAEIVSRCGKKPVPLKASKAEVDVIFVNLGGSYDAGDRVQMPDGRRGFVAVATREDGTTGVVPNRNSEPQGISTGVDAAMSYLNESYGG